jgi:hypothetical protein
MLRFAQNRDPDRKPILRPHFTVWAVLDGDDLLAAATARMTVEKTCEVVLVAGVDHRKWLKELDRRIGAAAAEAGATRMSAIGRAGWAKSLKALGWASDGDGKVRTYWRALEN